MTSANGNRWWSVGAACAAALIALFNVPSAQADADLEPFQDLFGDSGINTWTPAADSFLSTIDPTGTLAGNLDASVDNFIAVAGPPYFYGPDLAFSDLAYGSDPGAFSIPIPMIEFLTPLDATGDFSLGLDYAMFATGLAPVVDSLITDVEQIAALPTELGVLLVILGLPFGI